MFTDTYLPLLDKVCFTQSFDVEQENKYIQGLVGLLCSQYYKIA